jgi:hypothetical protein
MTETKLHINYCESFGITPSEIEATEEKQGTPQSSNSSELPAVRYPD